eukprot:Pgem_evm1s1603
METYKQRRALSVYWSKPDSDVPVSYDFGKYKSRNRFGDISAYLRLDDFDEDLASQAGKELCSVEKFIDACCKRWMAAVVVGTYLVCDENVCCGECLIVVNIELVDKPDVQSAKELTSELGSTAATTVSDKRRITRNGTEIKTPKIASEYFEYAAGIDVKNHTRLDGKNGGWEDILCTHTPWHKYFSGLVEKNWKFRETLAMQLINNPYINNNDGSVYIHGINIDAQDAVALHNNLENHVLKDHPIVKLTKNETCKP